MSKKSKYIKVLSSTAILASVAVPTMAAEATVTYSGVVLEDAKGNLYSISKAQYELAAALGTLPANASMKYVEVNNKPYSMDDYGLIVALGTTGDAAFKELVDTKEPVVDENIKPGDIENGELVPDQTPSITVEAINATGVFMVGDKAELSTEIDVAVTDADGETKTVKLPVTWDGEISTEEAGFDSIPGKVEYEGKTYDVSYEYEVVETPEELEKLKALKAFEQVVTESQKELDSIDETLSYGKVSDAVTEATDATYELSQDSSSGEIKAAQKLVDTANKLLVEAETAITTVQKAVDEAKAKAQTAGVATEDIEDVLFNFDPSYVQDTLNGLKADLATAQDEINAALGLTLKVKSVSAVNGTVTVKLAEAAKEVKASDFNVTQSINKGAATGVTVTKAVLAEDGVTVTLTVAPVEAKDVAQSVVYTVNKVAAEAFEVDAVGAELEVKSVTAVNANAVKVTFNKAVDTTKAVFAVKRGTVTEDVKVTWNEAKTEATLTKSGNFIAGDYTVTVTGIEIAEGGNVGTVKVEAEIVKSINIANTAIQDLDTAPLALEFINQYGEKATIAANDKNLTVTVFNKTKGESLGTLVNNKFQLDVSSADVKDEIVVTVIYNGITATKTLNVVAPASVGTLTLGEVVLPTGKDKFTPTGTKNVEVKYTAENTLGETYKLVENDLGVKFLSSNQDIVEDSDIKIDAEGKIRIDKFKKAGTVTITALTQATGKTSQVTIEVQADAGVPETVELEKSLVTFAAGSQGKLYVGVTVKDNYSTVIPTKDLKTADYSITSDNPDVVESAQLILTGEHAGKIEVTPASTSIKKGQSATITVLVKSTGQKATFKVTAADEALPTSIEQKGTTAVPTSLVVGGTTDIGFEIKDQYGAVLSTIPGYTVEYVTSDDQTVSITKDVNTNSTTINGLKLRVKAEKAGSATIKAQLKKGDLVVSEKAYSIQVLANTSAGSTYAVTPVEPIYKGKLTKDLAGQTLNDFAAADDYEKIVKSGYAEKLELKVTQGTSTSVVPNSALAGAPTVEVKKADGSATTGQLSVVEYNDSYYVYTSTTFDTADFTTANGSTADLKGKVTFTVNAEDGLEVVTQEITVSKEELKAQSVEFNSVVPGADKPVEVNSRIVETVASLDATGITDTYLWVKDQFGGYSLADSQSEVKAILKLVKGTNSVVTTPTITVDTSSSATVAQTGVIKATATTLTAKENNAVVRLYAQIGELTDTVNITITKENVAPTAVENSVNAASFQVTTPTTITVVFSEELDASKFSVGKNGFEVTNGGTLTSATLGTDGKTVTLTGTGFVGGKTKVSYTKGNLTDKVGNALATFSPKATVAPVAP